MSLSHSSHAPVAGRMKPGAVVDDRYVIERMIGEGGMGLVYRAHHHVLGKTVAIKWLHPALARTEEARARFVREAKAASSIQNPHVVDVLDFGQLPDGSHYYAMEYLEGISIEELVDQRGPLSLQLVIDIALQLVDGLMAAHELGIVHRDLKAENVTLINEGNDQYLCKILDFGIAKLVSPDVGSAKLTMPGAVLGTPHYMSPEQTMGRPVDYRTDIYALGVMFFEMVTGRLPFDGDTIEEIMQKQLCEPAPAIKSLVDDCPLWLSSLIARMLEKDPDDRPQSTAEILAQLKHEELTLLDAQEKGPDAATFTSTAVTTASEPPSEDTFVPTMRRAAQSTSLTRSLLLSISLRQGRRLAMIGASVLVLSAAVLSVVGVKHTASDRDLRQATASISRLADNALAAIEILRIQDAKAKRAAQTRSVPAVLSRPRTTTAAQVSLRSARHSRARLRNTRRKDRSRAPHPEIVNPWPH